MCYRVLVITGICVSDEKHVVSAKIAWRQCEHQAKECAVTGQWNVRCDDADYEPLVVTSSRARRVQPADCRVCSMHVMRITDGATELQMTREYHVIWARLREHHRQMDNIRAHIRVNRDAITDLTRAGQQNIAEYGRLEDNLRQLSEDLVVKGNDVVSEQRNLNLLCEDRENWQISKIKNAALRAQEGEADKFFFGNRETNHVHKELEAGEDYPRDFPNFNRRDYPQNLVPFYVLDERSV